MNAAEVTAALRKRYDSERYLVLEEVPLSSDRGGRRIDLVAFGLWRSRGLTIDAVEIKVSVADWRRELKDPGKADAWHHRADRLWIAAPTKVAAKIADELPETWGLLSITDKGTVTEQVKAPKSKQSGFSWSEVLGLLRTAEASSGMKINRARQEGVEAGIEQGRRQARPGGWDEAAAEQTSEQLRQLRANVRAVEKATGVSIEGFGGNESLYTAIGILQRHSNRPDVIAEQLRRSSEWATRAADVLDPPT